MIAGGTLLGVIGALLTFAGVALVERTHQTRFAPDVPPEVIDAVSTISPPLDAGPEWRVVANIDSPFGRVIRLRPYLNSIEVRGSDCILYMPSHGNEAPDRIKPDAIGHRAPSTPGRIKPGDAGHGVPPAPCRVRHERPPASVGWDEISANLSSRPQLASDLLHPALGARNSGTLHDALRADPTVYVSLPEHDSAEWTLRLEVSIDTSDSAMLPALEDLPWCCRERQLSNPTIRSHKPDLSSGPVDLLLIIDPSDLTILEARDMRLYSTHDYPGRALIFKPNPVAYSGRTELRDGDPVDQYRVWMDAQRLDGSGYLRGRWIETANNRPPLARETSLVFSYPSYDPRFEEAMAYVHGDRALQHVEELGFSGLFANPLRLRVHGTAADNSWYSRATREVVYGSGGVDDAEDADIILHEIGHAIHDALVPGFDGGDTYALSEGFSDFWAASLTDGPCIGDWDATSYSPPCLRRTDTDAVYPYSLNGRPHNDGMIWSATLWDIRSILGAETAERLALASFLEQDTRTTFPEAAAGLLLAAERLGMRDSLHLVRGVLEDRGLLPRSFHTEILPHDTYIVPLAAPGRILGGWTRSFVISGDGRVFFPYEANKVFALPFPQGPPCIAPLAWVDMADVEGDVRSSHNSDAGECSIFTSLNVTGSVSASHIDLEMEWKGPWGTLGRVDAIWDLGTGGFTWEYRHFHSTTAGLYFGVSSGDLSPDLVTPISLAELPRNGQQGARGFRTDLGDSRSPDWLPNLVGARFALSQDEDASGLRLRALAAPLKPGRLTMTTHPNPFHDSVRVRLRLEGEQYADISVIDTQGRRVRSLLRETLQQGAHTIEWDGRDDAGRQLPSAVYWIRASAGEELRTAGILRLR